MPWWMRPIPRGMPPSSSKARRFSARSSFVGGAAMVARRTLRHAPAGRIASGAGAEQCRGRPVVGRVEGLDRELGERDVDSGAERRHGAEPGELAVAVAKAKR